MTTTTVLLLTPEIVLIVAAATIYLGGTFSMARSVWRWVAGAAVLLAAALLWAQHGPAESGGSINLDALAWFGRWLALGFGGLFVMLTSRPLEETGEATSRELPQLSFDENGTVPLHRCGAGGTPEYVGSLLLTIAGLMLVAGAGELVLLFVGLELISIPTYVMLYLGRRDAACRESAAKYFFLSVLASAILLYGFSFLYGTTGATELADVRAALDGTKTLPTGFDTMAKLAMALIFAGLCFKVAAVPFHFYAPDVYQGNTHPNAALLSVVPKTAGLLAMARVLVIAMPGMEPYSWRIVLATSILTMTFGNVMALWQDDLRRLLAYSSIAQAGYMLLSLAVGMASCGAPHSWDGIAALWFYLATYAVATIGAFAVWEHLGRASRSLDAVDELAGLGRTRPMAAAVLAVCLFSLAGIPPLAGFWGKLFVFGSALNVGETMPPNVAEHLRPWFIGAAIVGVLNAVVAAAYYLRVVAVMYFRTPLATPRARGGTGAWCTAVACALLVIGLGVYPGPLVRESNCASARGTGPFFGEQADLIGQRPVHRENRDSSL